MINTLVHVLRGAGKLWALLALGLAAPAVGANEPQLAKPAHSPAMWIVQDHDTTIYLFGTFHALDGRSPWFDGPVRSAFDSADELVLETVIPDDPAELRSALQRNGMAAGAHAASNPMLASTRTVMAAGRSVGMSTKVGADSVLRRAARDDGKKVDGLESLDFQLAMYRSLPVPAASPAAATTSVPAGQTTAVAAMLQQLQTDWSRGRAENFAILLARFDASSPNAYRILFSDRNAQWAGWIQQRLEQPGTIFVAVGTGHLVGRDSVLNKLAERGIGSRRIS